MDLSCPVSGERVNENIVRVIAFIVAIIGILCLIFSNYWAILFLTIDFSLRAFSDGKFSPLKFIGSKIWKAFALKTKMTDLAPKKFAAKLGFIFCLLISSATVCGLYTASLILTSILIAFALLESVFGICVGCYVYTFWLKIKGDSSSN